MNFGRSAPMHMTSPQQLIERFATPNGTKPSIVLEILGAEPPDALPNAYESEHATNMVTNRELLFRILLSDLIPNFMFSAPSHVNSFDAFPRFLAAKSKSDSIGSRLSLREATVRVMFSTKVCHAGRDVSKTLQTTGHCSRRPRPHLTSVSHCRRIRS